MLRGLLVPFSKLRIFWSSCALPDGVPQQKRPCSIHDVVRCWFLPPPGDPFHLSCRKESFVVISFHSWSDWTPSAPLCLRSNEPDILLFSSFIRHRQVSSSVVILRIASFFTFCLQSCSFLWHRWMVSPDFFFISSVPVPELLQQALTGSEISLPAMF